MRTRPQLRGGLQPILSTNDSEPLFCCWWCPAGFGLPDRLTFSIFFLTWIRTACQNLRHKTGWAELDCWRSRTSSSLLPTDPVTPVRTTITMALLEPNRDFLSHLNCSTKPIESWSASIVSKVLMHGSVSSPEAIQAGAQDQSCLDVQALNRRPARARDHD